MATMGFEAIIIIIIGRYGNMDTHIYIHFYIIYRYHTNYDTVQQSYNLLISV